MSGISKDTSKTAKVRQKVLAVELNRDELACRIFEALSEYRRPDGMTPEQALIGLTEEQQAGLSRAAMAVMLYFRDQVTAGASIQ